MRIMRYLSRTSDNNNEVNMEIERVCKAAWEDMEKVKQDMLHLENVCDYLVAIRGKIAYDFTIAMMVASTIHEINQFRLQEHKAEGLLHLERTAIDKELRLSERYFQLSSHTLQHLHIALEKAKDLKTSTSEVRSSVNTIRNQADKVCKQINNLYKFKPFVVSDSKHKSDILNNHLPGSHLLSM